VVNEGSERNFRTAEGFAALCSSSRAPAHGGATIAAPQLNREGSGDREQDDQLHHRSEGAECCQVVATERALQRASAEPDGTEPESQPRGWAHCKSLQHHGLCLAPHPDRITRSRPPPAPTSPRFDNSSRGSRLRSPNSFGDFRRNAVGSSRGISAQYDDGRGDRSGARLREHRC